MRKLSRIPSEALLDSAAGKRTLGLDGKTDVCGRATVNFGNMKQGVVAYLSTRFLKKQKHSGETHAQMVQETIGDAKHKYQAVVADNTGNMQTMFRLLRSIYPLLFFLGCCIHVLDLLIEDLAKLQQIANLVADFHFIIVFIKRNSLLFETFLEAQISFYGANKFLSLRIFPLTRFAYCYLMVLCVLRNILAAVIRDIPTWAEFAIVRDAAVKVARRDKRPAVEAEFRRFETLVESAATKKAGEGILALLSPFSLVLHFLEGDSVPCSYILPLYASLLHFAKHLPDSVRNVLEEATIDAVQEAVRSRWTGSSQHVGLRHVVHGLAFALDPFVRAAVKALFGADHLGRLDMTYGDAAVYKAIQNYCGGDVGPKYTRLVSQFNKYKAREGHEFEIKVATVEKLVDVHLSTVVLPSLQDVERADHRVVLVKLLSTLHVVGTASIWWRTFPDTCPDFVAFTQMAVNVLQIVPHACGIERLNKNHHNVHTKGRAKMGESQVVKLVYCYTNSSRGSFS